MDENTKHLVAAKLTEIFFAPIELETVTDSTNQKRRKARSRQEILNVYGGFVQDLGGRVSESDSPPTGT